MKQYFTPIEKIAENSKIGVFKDTIIIQPTYQVLMADRDATVFYAATIEYGLIEQKPHYKIYGRQKTYEDVDDSYTRLEDALAYYPEHLVKYKQRVFSDGDYVVKGCMIREFEGEIFVSSEQITGVATKNKTCKRRIKCLSRRISRCRNYDGIFSPRRRGDSKCHIKQKQRM